MTIPGTHLQMVHNKCKKFQKNSCTLSLKHAWIKSCPQTWDRQTYRRTDRQTDRQTDKVKSLYLPTFVCSGITIIISLGQKVEKNNIIRKESWYITQTIIVVE